MKNMVFLIQKVDGNMIFTDYWKVHVLIFSELGNRTFFEPKGWWKDDIYWLLKRSRFELFGDVKYRLFFSQNVDGKMIYTWSFWAFHDIPGPGKYVFSCSGYIVIMVDIISLQHLRILCFVVKSFEFDEYNHNFCSCLAIWESLLE